VATKAAVNKSQAIRDAVAAHPEKSNIQISELLKTQGLKVKPQYISTIKGNAKKKRRGKRAGKKTMARAGGNGFAGVGPALEFIKASGGLEAAKAALSTIEEIGRIVG